MLAQAIFGERRYGGDTSTLADPKSWLMRLFGGHPTASGIEVSEATAPTIAAVWACLQVISEDVAKLPLVTYQRLEPRGKRRLTRHPVYRILHDRPNPEATAITFRQAMTWGAAGWGRGVAEIERRGNGEPIYLWYHRPDRVRIYRGADRKIWFEFTNDQGRRRQVPDDDVFHLMGPSFDGVTGMSVVSYARESMGLTAATERFGAAFFGNGSVPSGILKHAGALKDDQKRKLKDGWEEAHRGADRAQRVAVLDAGLTYESIGLPAKDSQFLESRQFQIPEICRWFRVSPVKIGDLSRSTFSNIEHLAIAHVVDTLLPWLTRWEQEIKRKLFLGREDDLFAEHVVNGLLRGDMASRFEAYSKGRQWGWYSANDVRELENENPIPEGGDVYLQPVNMAPAGSPAASGVPAAPRETGDRSAAEALAAAAGPVLTDAYGRLAKVEADKIGRAMKREGFAGWFETFLADHRDHVRAALFAPAEGFVRAAAIIEGREADPRAYVDGLADRHIQRLREAFGAGAAPAEWTNEAEAAEELRALMGGATGEQR